MGQRFKKGDRIEHRNGTVATVYKTDETNEDVYVDVAGVGTYVRWELSCCKPYRDPATIIAEVRMLVSEYEAQCPHLSCGMGLTCSEVLRMRDALAAYDGEDLDQEPKCEECAHVDNIEGNNEVLVCCLCMTLQPDAHRPDGCEFKPRRGNEMGQKHTEDPWSLGEHNRRNNACREACDNAGITTEALEAGVVGEMVKALECMKAHFEGFETMPAWGDELLAVASKPLAKLNIKE